MLNWASEGFLPTGPEGFTPPGMCTFRNIYLFTNDCIYRKLVQTVSVCVCLAL